MSVEAPEAPAAPPAEAVASPAAPPAAPVPAPPRVPPGQPDGGQFAPPAAQPAVPAPPAQPETDWKAEAERHRAAAERAEADAARWKAQSRAQETRSKANHTRAQGLEGVVRQIAEKLEIPFDDKPNPEEVSRALAERTAEARQLRVERAIYLTAAREGGDANALLDSREFISRTEQIDPEASDFADQVADLVRDAAKLPRYAAPARPAAESLTPQVTQAPAQQQPAAQFQQPPQPPAQASGADFSGAPGQGRLWTQADYDNYMATSHVHDRDGRKLTEAIGRGELTALGIGPGKRRNRR